MYICICNAVSDTRINAAIAKGNTCACAVYKECGVRPQCGKCKETIEEMISELKDK